MADIIEFICTKCERPYFFAITPESGPHPFICSDCTKGKSDLEITSSELKPGVKPRKLRATWRFDSTEELRRLRGGDDD